MRPEGLGKFKYSPHRLSNPRPLLLTRKIRQSTSAILRVLISFSRIFSAVHPTRTTPRPTEGDSPHAFETAVVIQLVLFVMTLEGWKFIEIVRLGPFATRSVAHLSERLISDVAVRKQLHSNRHTTHADASST
jgi:hypothetical protein